MARTSTDSSDHLLRSALELFGQRGFAGASCRAIAKAAGMTMSQITYHFGGKEELYRAVARHVAGEISRGIPLTGPVGKVDMCPADARARIKTLFAAFLGLMVQPRNVAWVGFIMREQMEPTQAFEELYQGAIGPILEELSALLRAVSRNRLSVTDAQLRAVSMFGQALVFRLARAAVLRLNQWSDIAGVNGEMVQAAVLGNLDAILDSIEAGAQTTSVLAREIPCAQAGS
ncbi:MAG: hypothetical protein JWR80_5299 [Bradyrhizobium sp.]|nr:hypothetical protein [Bradyrhizobium sp.]